MSETPNAKHWKDRERVRQAKAKALPTPLPLVSMPAQHARPTASSQIVNHLNRLRQLHTQVNEVTLLKVKLIYRPRQSNCKLTHKKKGSREQAFAKLSSAVWCTESHFFFIRQPFLVEFNNRRMLMLSFLQGCRHFILHVQHHVCPLMHWNLTSPPVLA